MTRGLITKDFTQLYIYIEINWVIEELQTWKLEDRTIHFDTITYKSNMSPNRHVPPPFSTLYVGWHNSLVLAGS